MLMSDMRRLWRDEKETRVSQQVALTFGVFVAQRGLSHVAQSQGAFAAAVDEKVTVVGVELCRRDHLGQILHVGWLNVHDV